MQPGGGREPEGALWCLEAGQETTGLLGRLLRGSWGARDPRCPHLTPAEALAINQSMDKRESKLTGAREGMSWWLGTGSAEEEQNTREQGDAAWSSAAAAQGLSHATYPSQVWSVTPAPSKTPCSDHHEIS